MINNSKKKILFSIYLLGFLFSLQAALPNYINSSYLETLMSERFVGIIFALEAVLAIAGFLYMPKVLRKFGNFKVAITLLLVELVSLFSLAVYHNFIVVSFFMICSMIIFTFFTFSFDVFLEGYSTDGSTGKTRGIYLTSLNFAWMLSPIITGLVLSNGDYWKIYLMSFILVIPVFIILIKTLNGFKDSTYIKSNPFSTIAEVWKNKDIFNIFMSGFLLQLFYCWMTIYTPMYLHINLGYSWKQIGLIFFIMLIPFVLIQAPLGRLADKKYGEKEILSIGFIIIAISTVVIYFINSGSVALNKVLFSLNMGGALVEITGYVLLWAFMLFMTRVGAAAVEVMCDAYFFKNIDGKNTNLISFYRMARPFAYIIGPLIALALLSIPGFEIKILFLVLGIIMILGLKFGLSIKDTK